MEPTTRRDFMKQAAAGICAAGLLPLGYKTFAAEGDIPKRMLGKTGEEVSILGLGGAHAADMEDEQQVIRLIQQAVDSGITFMDNAWCYGWQGSAEKLMGRALAAGGRRDKVFLMTKHHGRDYDTTMKYLEDSLRRLQTDVIDLWQFHEVIYYDDPEWIFTRGGIEAAIKAKEQGKVRFIGFTGHKDPSIHMDMLNRYDDWEAVQMPVNCMDPHYHSFVNSIVPYLKKRNIGVIGMKSVGGGHILQSGVCTADEAIRFALSQPIDTLVSGIENFEHLEKNVATARGFQPMPEEEQKALLAKTKEPAATGNFERFKSRRTFDSGEGRKLHGVPRDAR